MAKQKQPFYLNSLYQHTLLLAVIVAIVLSVVAITQSAPPEEPEGIPLAAVLNQMTATPGLESLQGVPPVNVILIAPDNLEALAQQIEGINESFIGQLLVEYQNSIIVYDFQNDQITGLIPIQSEAAAELSANLFAHDELADVQNEQPVGGPLTAEAAEQIKDQAAYEDAKEGDFLLQFSNKIVLYDPVEDEIVAVVETEEE